MSEIRGDPAIKLFGRTIPLPQLLTTAGDSTVSRDAGGGEREEEKDTQKDESIDKDKDDERSKSPSADKDDRETDANSSQGKALNLKKPDKILPCPRCKSLDTKFCYFNNYNVNQPRHFCKNCQRYWTAGGTMRNVPVGSGRRKSKAPSGPHFHHVAVSDSLNSDGPRSPSILRFGPDNIPISALNLVEQPIKNCSNSGGGENPMIHSSSIDGAKANVNLNGSSSQWPYPWNSAPAFCASSFPIPFYPPTAYWTIPWLAPIASNSPALGKHSRGGDDSPQVWVPKTLRIDNPDEASKSSIWAMMGAKSDKNETSSGGRGLFKKEFQTKQGSENSGVLEANPAALSRSLSFQERS